MHHYDIEIGVRTYHDDKAHEADNSVPFPPLCQIAVPVRVDRLSGLLAADELLTNTSHSVGKAVQQLHGTISLYACWYRLA